MILPPLRYGVLLDSATVNAWQAAVLEHLQESGDAELALLVILSGTSRGARARQRRSLSEQAGTAAFNVYSTRLSHSRALRPSGVAPWPADVPVVRVPAVRAEQSRLAFRAEDIETIREQRLDFLMDFGSGRLTGAVLETARFGIWSFRHGDEPLHRGRPPGFWELVDGQPVVGVALDRLTAGPDDGATLQKGWFAAAPESYALTRDRLLLGAAGWPANVCHGIRAGTADMEGPPSPPTAARPRTLSAIPFLRFLSVTTRARLRKYWHHGMRHDDWNIGVVDAPVASLLARQSIPEVRWAPGRRGHYAADPFGRWDGATLDILYEDYSHAHGIASIARRRWTRDRGWALPEPALEIGSHLSYPFPFEHEGRQLMLPETRASGRLVVYEADRIDGSWRPWADLGLGVDVADATVLQHDGRWWLFAVRSDRLNPATELLLWFADRPEGPWQEHPLNPVVIDVRSARPAGPLFRVDGQLYRPAQDCSTGYGDRLAVKRVVTLTAEHYEEEMVRFLEPERGGPFPYGLHTLTGAGDVTLVDGKRWVWNTAATVRAIRRRLPL